MIKEGKLKIVLVSLNIRENYSLALGFLKAYLEKDMELRERVETIILNFDLRQTRNITISEKISELKPEIVGFSAYTWNINQIMFISKELKNVDPSLNIVLGGPDSSPIAEEILNFSEQIDIIVRGEGELTFYELVKSYSKRKLDLQKILGITFRDGVSNKVISNGNQRLISDLDEIPSPYLNGYIDVKNMEPIANVETFRGCVFKCIYCFENKDYGCIRFFSSERIRDELEYLKQNDVYKVYLANSTFNADKKKMREVCECISKVNSDYKMYIIVELKAELVDEEVCKSLKIGHISEGGLGLQSVDEKTNQNIRRWFDRDKFEKGVRLLSENRINYQIHIIIGLPGDNYFRFIRTLKFALHQGPYQIFPFLLSVLPGAEIRGLTEKFEIRYDRNAPYEIISSYSFSEKEIKIAQLCSKSILKEYASVIR
ncbi:MAG: radical SAM protein [Nanoarchaeota archaeon]|nr:radical SAM protein [Nanoarchaeota archaeon]